VTSGQVYERAEKVFGQKRQMVKAAEEFAELTAILLKFANGDPPAAVEDVLNEMVDAEIMLEQLQRFFREYLPAMEGVKLTKIQRLTKVMDLLEG
jgi:hypothetical protein